MIELEKYMNDGACWQSQAVLAFVRAFYPIEHTEVNFTVGRYENCREQGYVFNIHTKGKSMNYAVYEHRNSDALCVVKFEGYFVNTPRAEDTRMKDKWDITKEFRFGEILECGEYLIKDMNDTINKWMEE